MVMIRAEILRSRWMVRFLRSHGAVVGEGVTIGWGANVSLGEGATLKIGDNVRVDRYTDLIVWGGSTMELGEGIYIGKRNIISAVKSVKIGAHTMTAHQVTVIDSNHEFSSSILIKDQGPRSSPIEIGPDCWLGANSSVLAGVSLGAKTVVGAHCLVNKSFAGHSVIGGLPAAEIRKF